MVKHSVSLTVLGPASRSHLKPGVGLIHQRCDGVGRKPDDLARLWMRNDSTLADLYYTIQITFD